MLSLTAEASSSCIYAMYLVMHFPLPNVLLLQVAVGRNRKGFDLRKCLVDLYFLDSQI